MPNLYVTASVIALLGGQIAMASAAAPAAGLPVTAAAPIIIGPIPSPTPSPAPVATTVPKPAASQAATPAPTPTPAAKPTPAPTPTPSAKPVAAAPAATPAGVPVAPDMKKYPNTAEFIAANRAYRAQVATAWARGQIDAPTFRSLMGVYRSNVQAAAIASGK